MDKYSNAEVYSAQRKVEGRRAFAASRSNAGLGIVVIEVLSNKPQLVVLLTAPRQLANF
jgi:hypothetical protein